MTSQIGLKSPIMPGNLEEIKLTGLDRGQEFNGAQIKEAVLSHVEARAVSIEGSRLENVEISSSKLGTISMIDVVLDHCLLFATSLYGATLRRAQILAGNYAGAAFTDTTLEDVSFNGAKLDMINFRVAKLKRVIFRDCDLHEADFQGARFEQVEFNNCNLSGAEFSGCIIKRPVDLRSSDLTGLKGVTDLRGANIGMKQLIGLSPILAAELGLVVED